MKDWKQTWKLLRKKINNFYSYNKFIKKIKNDIVFSEMCKMLEKILMNKQVYFIVVQNDDKNISPHHFLNEFKTFEEAKKYADWLIEDAVLPKKSYPLKIEKCEITIKRLGKEGE